MEAYVTVHRPHIKVGIQWRRRRRSDGRFIQFVVQPNRDLLFTYSSTSSMLSTSTSNPLVACVVDTKYLNELVHGIMFPAKPAGLYSFY